MIQVIDTKTNNLNNVLRALSACQQSYQVINHANELRTGSVVVLPGVGAFENCMKSLQEKGFSTALSEHLKDNGKLLGICVGMQALAQYSTEFGQNDGLALVDAQVEHIAAGSTQPVLAPNVNWLSLQVSSGRFTKFAGSQFYFVHSYHMCNFRNPEQGTATVNYSGQKLCAIVETDNIIGFQFHPEKSGKVGLEILSHAISSFAES